MMKRSNPYAPPGKKEETILRANSLLNWLTPEKVLLFATFLVEGLWLYFWLVLLRHGTRLGWDETPLTLGSIVTVLFLSFYSVKVLGGQQWNSRKTTGIAIVVILTLLVLLVRIENGGGYALTDPQWLGYANHGITGSVFSSMQWTILGSLYLWWRGYHLARDGLSQRQVFHSFIVGLITIALGLISWEALYRSGSLSGVARSFPIFVVTAYFFSSLLALSLSHLIRVQTEMMRREGSSGFFSNHWSLQLLGFVTAMLVAGLMMSTVFSFNIIAPLLWVLSGISHLLSLAIYYIAYPFAVLGTGLLYVFRWLLSKFGSGPQASITVPDFNAFRQAVPEGGQEGTALWIVLLKWVVVIALVSLAVYLLARLVLQRTGGSKTAEALEEVHESVGGVKAFIRDLLLGILALFAWFRGRRNQILQRIPVIRRTMERRIPDRELDIRELYSMLLLESRDAGLPRHHSETPLEYQDKLQNWLPVEREALEHMTHYYMLERYGEGHIRDTSRINRMWRAVSQRIRNIVHATESE
ncbi:MAG: DUF4129 domain-containing protein [Chloroflexota bacterium]|nr:DUF4129 domain-containing protein [Chloroflexota bacterium]